MEPKQEILEQEIEEIYKLDENVCIVAGAGTGKTTLLVKRYLYLLEEKKAVVPEIIAITFTEKAALEMKERIRNACECKITTTEGAEKIFWTQQRHLLENAKITTIHGLCTAILKEHSIESNIDPGFTILDEKESFVLRRKIVEHTLLHLAEENDRDIAELFTLLGMKECISIFNSLLAKRIDMGPICNKFLTMSKEDWLLYWETLMTKLKEQCLNDIILHLNINDVLSDLEDLPHLSYLSEIGELTKIKYPEEKIKRFINIWENLPKKIFKNKIQKHITLLQSKFNPLDEINLKYARNIFQIFKKIWEEYESYKFKNGLVDFDDLIIKTKKLLNKDLRVRRLYQKSIKYILVDEYQDTDSHQKEIIIKLASKPYSSPCEDLDVIDTSKLFIVGDPKQSIYRFRGADVEVFTETMEMINKNGIVREININRRALSTNIKFYNTFFPTIMKGRKDVPFEIEYTSCHPKRTVEDAPYTLEIITLPEENLKAPERRKKEAELIAKRILQITEEGKPYVYENVDGKEIPRNPEFRDFGILFHAATDLYIYEQALQEYSIPYHTVSGTRFYHSQEIKDILNILKVISNPYDELALAGVLRSPMVGITDETIFLLKYHYKLPLYEILQEIDKVEVITGKEKEKLIRFNQFIVSQQEIRDRISISSLVELIVKQTGYLYYTLTQYIGKQRFLNVKKLLSDAAEFDQKGIFSLQDFISYLDESITIGLKEPEAALLEERDNVVRLMTIHKAKGLEFPIVIIPDIGRLSLGNRGIQNLIYTDPHYCALGINLKNAIGEQEDSTQRMWLKYINERKDIAELKRLLYVATTRARDYLILSGVPEKPPSNAYWAKWITDFIPLEGKEGIYSVNGLKIKITRKIDLVRTTQKPSSFYTQYREYIDTLSKIPTTLLEIKLPKPIPYKQTHFTASQLTEFLRNPKSYKAEFLYGYPGYSNQTLSLRKPFPQTLLGIYAHKAFQLWNFSAENIIPIVEKVLSGCLEEKRIIKEKLIKYLHNFTATPIFQKIKKANIVQKEIPLLYRLGEYIIEGIIDLIFSFQNEWYVLDYKTDSVTGEETTQYSQTYNLQLSIYALGISKIKGIIPEHLILYYLEPNIIKTYQFNREKLKTTEQEILRIIDSINQGCCSECYSH